tara:strand:- start:557 stop:1072 length:516 start_codon:yes stop_codon:yes gene_type:complete
MKSVKKLINHKLFFWITIFFVSAHFIFLIQSKNYKCLIVFTALCFIMKNVSKNLSIGLIIAVFISSTILGCSEYREGMANKKDLEDVTNLIKAGSVNTGGVENVQKMMSQLESLKKKGGTDMGLDMGSLNELLKFNSKISSSKLTSKDDVKKAVDHLRANKELLKNMIDKF